MAGKIDSSKVGVMGHSRGGKAAVNACAADSRFIAVLGLDPVNSCGIGTCPDGIANMAGLAIPSGFLGETTDDGSGGGSLQACAPAADNFQKFYEAANAPSLQVDVLGANHMSFVSDTTACLQCAVCATATLDQAVVLDLSYAYTAAFFQRYLLGINGYDTYLTGTEAQQRYVQTGYATVTSK